MNRRILVPGVTLVCGLCAAVVLWVGFAPAAGFARFSLTPEVPTDGKKADDAGGRVAGGVGPSFVPTGLGAAAPADSGPRLVDGWRATHVATGRFPTFPTLAGPVPSPGAASTDPAKGIVVAQAVLLRATPDSGTVGAARTDAQPRSAAMRICDPEVLDRIVAMDPEQIEALALLIAATTSPDILAGWIDARFQESRGRSGDPVASLGLLPSWASSDPRTVEDHATGPADAADMLDWTLERGRAGGVELLRSGRPESRIAVTVGMALGSLGRAEAIVTENGRLVLVTSTGQRIEEARRQLGPTDPSRTAPDRSPRPRPRPGPGGAG